ncbi:uncharacterized protein LOC142587006 isoform X2 [Dermacentor variabilis]
MRWKSIFTILLLGVYATRISGRTLRGSSAAHAHGRGAAFCEPMNCPIGKKYNCLIKAAHSYKQCVFHLQACHVAWQSVCNGLYYTLHCCSAANRCICHCDPKYSG